MGRPSTDARCSELRSAKHKEGGHGAMMRTNGPPTSTWITAKWRTIPRLHLGNSTPGNTHSKTKRESTITATNSRARCRWRKNTTSPKKDAVRMKTGTNTWNSPKRKVGVFWHKRTHQMLPSASERNQKMPTLDWPKAGHTKCSCGGNENGGLGAKRKKTSRYTKEQVFRLSATGQDRKSRPT